MMRPIFGLILASLLTVTAAAQAQPAKQHFRVGYLSIGNPSSEAPRAEAIVQRLREHGYAEGQNLTVDYRHGEGDDDRLAMFAAELVRLKPDVILVTGGSGSIRAAMQATKTIPIVMAGQGIDPVEAGYVKSIARPGGNVTGITNISGGLGGKRLELIKEAIGRVSNVAVLHAPDSRSNAFELKNELPQAARALNLRLQPRAVSSAEDIEKAFALMAKQRPDALYLLGNPRMRDNRKRVAELALKNRLPSMSSNKETVEAGGLMSYGADLVDSHRQVAVVVDRILKGSRPADLPVQQPMKFEFVVNLKTAKTLNLDIPQSVLFRADKVIR